jgi:hypothetical protein
MNRVGFLIFISGLIVGSYAIAFIGFLVYEYSRPITWLAFVSSGKRG